MPTATQKRRSVRVLVVDDDPLYRQILRRSLEQVEGAEVVGSAATIGLARRKVEAGGVDLVTIDVVLAGESGLELLSWLREHHRKVAAVLVTSGTTASAKTEIDGVLLGAVGLVRKPSGTGAAAALRDELARFVDRVAGAPREGGGTAARRLRRTIHPPAPGVVHTSARRELIAVGASTGGPPVVLDLLVQLPSSFRPPVVIAQHISVDHVGHFAAHLRSQSGRPVSIPSEGEPLKPGHVYLAGHDRHLLVARGVAGNLVARLSDTPPEHNCRPAVDPLFRSVAAVCGAAAVGVLATGMGCDGAQGTVALRGAGAPVVVQDEDTSVVWGMPGAATKAGGADVVAPGGELAMWVQRWTRSTGCDGGQG